jgi:phosphate:Na+ symporter
MLPLFFVSMDLLVWVMGWFGGDPGVATIVNGKETFPLVPVAVGLYSTAFNIFNTALMFPFINVFYSVLSKIGHSSADDKEEYSTPRYLVPGAQKELSTGVVAVQQESMRYLEGATKFMAIARGEKDAPDDVIKHYEELDVLSREIRNYTAAMLRPDMPRDQVELLASMIEEEDWTASLGETLYQIARRIERQPFSAAGLELVNATLDQVTDAMHAIAPNGNKTRSVPDSAARLPALQALRDRCLKLGAELPWAERGAILTLLGSAERAYYLIERIDAERKSVARVFPAAAGQPRESGLPLGGAVVPA